MIQTDSYCRIISRRTTPGAAGELPEPVDPLDVPVRVDYRRVDGPCRRERLIALLDNEIDILRRVDDRTDRKIELVKPLIKLRGLRGISRIDW